MVNGWLRLHFAAMNIGEWRPVAAKPGAFRIMAALTSSSRRGAGRSEVVLAHAILGLLVNPTAALAAGN
jgi:hypothetical protein